MRAGFTLIEMMVVIAVIVILVGILVPVVGRARAGGLQAACLANLRQIHVALHLYADANRTSLPDPSATLESWESLLRRHVPTAGIYHCPADGGLFEKLRSSYDWRDTGDKRTTIAGRSILEVRRKDAVLVFDALPDWHMTGRINALRMDGSAESMDHQECLRDLDRPVDTP